MDGCAEGSITLRCVSNIVRHQGCLCHASAAGSTVHTWQHHLWKVASVIFPNLPLDWSPLHLWAIHAGCDCALHRIYMRALTVCNYRHRHHHYAGMCPLQTVHNVITTTPAPLVPRAHKLTSWPLPLTSPCRVPPPWSPPPPFLLLLCQALCPWWAEWWRVCLLPGQQAG